jgi:hypothetical protein
VADRPECDADEPLLEAQAHRSRDRAVDDRDAARCAAQQDRRAQTGVDRCLEASDMTVVDVLTRRAPRRRS